MVNDRLVGREQTDVFPRKKNGLCGSILGGTGFLLGGRREGSVNNKKKQSVFSRVLLGLRCFHFFSAAESTVLDSTFSWPLPAVAAAAPEPMLTVSASAADLNSAEPSAAVENEPAE